MNTIKKTLMASLLACAIFNAQAEVNPFSYGMKLAASASSAIGGSDYKINSKEANGGLLRNPFINGSLYAEYAYTDYLGVGIEVGYMKLGGTLTAQNAQNSNNSTGDSKATKEASNNGSTSDASIDMNSHGIVMPIHLLQIYPLGREDESGILQVNLGITGYIPLSTTCTQNGTELVLTDQQKKELPGFSAAVHLGLGYEFPFGLTVGAKYGYGVYDKLSVDEGKSQTIFSDTTLKDNSFPTHHATFGVGYNFMSLFD